MKEKLNEIEFRTAQSRNKAKKFICKLMTAAFFDNKDLSKFIEIPATYFRKAYNGRYLEDFLNPLIENGIVQQNNSYSNKENERTFCKSYRIVQSWLYTNDTYEGENFVSERDGENDRTIFVNPETSIIKFNNNYITSTISIPYMLHHFEKAALKADFDSLYYNIDKLKEAAEQELDYIDLVLNEEIDVTYITGYDRIKEKKFKGMRNQILTKVKKEGYNLIQDGNNFYIDDLDRYIENKKDNMRLFSHATISKLKKGIFTTGRNSTNNRLDSNFTVMSKSLLKVIKEDNNLVEIDLCNSQFAILAHWLKQEGLADKYQDVSTFCANAESGTLYSSISSILPYMLHRFTETEETTKKKMMQMAFSHSGGERPEFKESCYRYMPNVIDFMDGYKKKYSYKSFSIELQKRESNIFIDNLLYNIKANGFFCITKHDSLIVRKSNLEEILQIISSYFHFIGFSCSVRVEKEIVRLDGGVSQEVKPALNPECTKNEHGSVLDTQILDQIKNATHYKAAPVLTEEEQLFEAFDEFGMSTKQQSIQANNPKEEMKKRYTVDELSSSKKKEDNSQPVPQAVPTKLQHLKTDGKKMDDINRIIEGIQEQNEEEKETPSMSSKEIAIDVLKAEGYKINQENVDYLTRIVKEEFNKTDTGKSEPERPAYKYVNSYVKKSA